jgi:hypothetical protein
MTILANGRNVSLGANKVNNEREHSEPERQCSRGYIHPGRKSRGWLRTEGGGRRTRRDHFGCVDRAIVHQ